MDTQTSAVSAEPLEILVYKEKKRGVQNKATKETKE